MNSDGLTLALIGGTGLTELDQHAETLDIDTPYGSPAAEIRVVSTEPVRLLFLPRHGSPHRFPPHRVNYRANLWALREAGANHVLAVSAVGGMGGEYSPGTLVAPDQLIDYSSGREHTYSDSDEAELVHMDFTNPYDGPLRTALLAAAKQAANSVADLEKEIAQLQAKLAKARAKQLADATKAAAKAAKDAAKAKASVAAAAKKLAAAKTKAKSKKTAANKAAVEKAKVGPRANSS